MTSVGDWLILAALAVWAWYASKLYTRGESKMIQFREEELEVLAKSPIALKVLIDYHTAQETMAAAIGEESLNTCVEYHRDRRIELEVASVRRFKHRTKFKDNTAYVECRAGKTYLVAVNGYRCEVQHLPIEECERYVAGGYWFEIPVQEEKAK